MKGRELFITLLFFFIILLSLCYGKGFTLEEKALEIARREELAMVKQSLDVKERQSSLSSFLFFLLFFIYFT